MHFDTQTGDRWPVKERTYEGRQASAGSSSVGPTGAPSPATDSPTVSRMRVSGQAGARQAATAAAPAADGQPETRGQPKGLRSWQEGLTSFSPSRQQMLLHPWQPAAQSVPPLELLYVDPACVAAAPPGSAASAAGVPAVDTPRTILLHLLWLPTTTSSKLEQQHPSFDPVTAAAAAEAELADTPWQTPQEKAADGDDTPKRASSASNVRPASSSSGSSSSSRATPSVAGCLELHGLLFQGAACVAEYSWPLPQLQPDAAGSCVTASMQLPAMSMPCVLQLILAAEATTQEALPATQQAATPRQQQAGASSRSILGGAIGSGSTGSSRAVLTAFSRCPITFLPPAAAAEVQQLLLPAMQQEVEQEWQQHSSSSSKAAVSTFGSRIVAAVPSSEGGGTEVPPLVLRSTVWNHWRALADDLGQVLQLQQLAQQQQQQQQLAQKQPAQQQQHGELAQQQQQTQKQLAQPQQHGELAIFTCGQTVPLLTSFLQAQGLSHCCALVVEAAAQVGQVLLPAAAVAAQAQVGAAAAGQGSQQQEASIAAAAAAARTQALATGQQPAVLEQQQEAAAAVGSVQGVGTAAMTSTGGSSSSSKAAGQPTSSTAHQRQEQVSADHHLTARTSWCLFPAPLEQQYLQYKHKHYIWLDYYAACFAVLWLVVLCARMAWERSVTGSLLYMAYILCKAGPYFRLLRGQVQQFQRSREVMISCVSQLLCLSLIMFGALVRDPVVHPATRAALSSAWQWLQQCGSGLQLLLETTPQLQDLRQLPGWQAVTSALAAAGAVLEQLPAAAVWLHQQLAVVYQVPESPMRAFWRMRGEYLVLVPMAIPQHVRLPYFVPSMLLEATANCYAFSWVFPLGGVVLRFVPALLLSIGLAWFFDVHVRAKFLGHLQQQEQQRAQRLAEKLQSVCEEEQQVVNKMPWLGSQPTGCM